MVAIASGAALGSEAHLAVAVVCRASPSSLDPDLTRSAVTMLMLTLSTSVCIHVAQM